MTTLRQLLHQTRQNMYVLQEREAKFGGNAPLELINQIRDHQIAIELIKEARSIELSETDFKELKETLRPLLLASNVEQIDLDALKIETPLLPFEPEIIFIPAGPFFMGSDTGQANEASLHEVKLPAYKIGKYPVTNAQYAEFLKRAYKPEYVPKRADWFLDDPPPDKLDHPVVGLSWQTAKAYCNWLTGETRQARIYRLPSEAEWEKAARGIEGQIYPWGNEWAAGRCNHTGEGTTPVGVYHEGASPYGCFDMIGNIQEWTSTLWGSSENDERFPYPYHRDDGREDLNPGRHLQQVYRIHRGGSYKDKIADLRCSARSCSNQKTEVPWRGFRVVLEV